MLRAIRNSMGNARRSVVPISCSILLLATAATLGAQVNVLTFHNDNARTGQNTNETELTPSIVNTNTFGKLFSQDVDGQIYGQPLYVANVAITNQGLHNVVYVATENDSVYAFDADSNTGSNAAPLWQVSFLDVFSGVTVVPSGDTISGNIVPVIGITATPVIDTATGTIYVEAETREITGSMTNYVHRLHALDLGSGAEKFGGPVVVSPTIAGTGDGNDGSGQVPFNSLRQLCWSGLLLSDGVVYLAYDADGGIAPFHGWLVGFDAHTLQQVSVFNTTPNGSMGGISQSGGAPATDDAGSIFFTTDNGTFDPATNNYGNSFLRLNETNLSVLDYFTPYNQAYLASNDLDLGSGGVVVLPDSAGSVAHPHLLVGAGKQGEIYLLDRDNLGQFNATNDNQIVQSLLSRPSYVTPAYFNNTLYYAGANDSLKAFSLTNAVLSGPTSASRTAIFFPGATPSVSANGVSNGIVWILETSLIDILHAYNASNLTEELYNSAQAGNRDNPGGIVSYVTPTIAGGKVFVGTASNLAVYGSGRWASPPAFAPNGAVFTNATTITLEWTNPNQEIYYTLDGLVPTTNSTKYISPFVLTNSAVVKAIGTLRDSTDSLVVSALFTKVSDLTTVAGFHINGLGWTLNNGATATNDYLILTDGSTAENHSAFFNTPQIITAFDAQFVYQSTGGADGAAFVLQNSPAGATAVGASGECLAICDILPSAALEFNLFSGHGGSGEAFVTNATTGNYNSTLPVDLNNGDPILVSLSYDGTNLTEHLTDEATGDVYTNTYAVDLPLAVGGTNTAFVGFTGATGGEVSRQTISSFSYAVRTAPATKPVILPDGGVFTNYAVVTLASSVPEAKIYYTLDGTLPTTAANLYSNVFVLTNSAVVTALAVETNLANSPVAIGFFNIVSSLSAITNLEGNASLWTLNGGAVLANNVLTLTDGGTIEARSAYLNVPQAITNFTARFVYQATAGNADADGAAFVMQNSTNGPMALSLAGSCLGYCGIFPSAAIEFNLYSGKGGSGTGFVTNGLTADFASTLPLNLDSGDPILVRLDYDGTTLRQRLLDEITGQTYDTNYVIDLPGSVGGTNSAYIGFSGGTGGFVSVQTVTEFSFGPNESFAGFPPPTLTAGVRGNQIVISWPTSTVNYVLESTPNINQPVWTPVSSAQIFTGQQTEIAIPIGTGGAFYRLHAQ